MRARLFVGLAAWLLMMWAGFPAGIAAQDTTGARLEGEPESVEAGDLADPRQGVTHPSRVEAVEPEVPLGTEVPLQELNALKRETASSAFSAVGGDADRRRAAAQAPTLATKWMGIEDTGYFPPDPQIAAGPQDLVAAVNRTWRIYSKNGTILASNTLASWFASVLPDHGKGFSLYDPSAIYDRWSNRFFLLAAANRAATKESYLVISVSDDSSAVGNWCKWRVSVQTTPAEMGVMRAEYPKLGDTNNAIVATANVFDFATNTFQYATVRVMPYSGLLSAACSGFTATVFSNLTHADGVTAFTVQPAQNYISGFSDTYLLASRSVMGSSLTLWRILTTTPGSTTLTRQATINVSAYAAPPNARQNGSSTRVYTGDARLLGAVYSSGLWSVHTIRCTWGTNTNYSCIRWYAITPNSNSVAHTNTYGASGFFYYYPAIMPNFKGETEPYAPAAMTFTRSGSTEYASMDYTGRKSTDPPDDFQDSAVLKAGEGCYVKPDANGRNLWGDYGGIARDPTGDISMPKWWIFHEYAKGMSAACTENTWETWVGKVKFP